MLKYLIIVSLLTCSVGCKKSYTVDKEKTVEKLSFTLDISKPYTLVNPIPESDAWLASFKKNHNYGKFTNPAVKEPWETWVWRKTSIDLGKGITVYARSVGEVQFLINGIPELNQICVNFREQSVGEGWSFGGMHNGALTPTGNYIVVITDHPRSHLGDGVCFKSHAKTDNGWDYQFSGKSVKFWKR